LKYQELRHSERRDSALHLCRVRTQNRDPDTVGGGCRGKGRKRGRGPTKYREKRNGRAGVGKRERWRPQWVRE